MISCIRPASFLFSNHSFSPISNPSYYLLLRGINFSKILFLFFFFVYHYCHYNIHGSSSYPSLIPRSREDGCISAPDADPQPQSLLIQSSVCPSHLQQSPLFLSLHSSSPAQPSPAWRPPSPLLLPRPSIPPRPSLISLLWLGHLHRGPCEACARSSLTKSSHLTHLPQLIRRRGACLLAPGSSPNLLNWTRPCDCARNAGRAPTAMPRLGRPLR